MKQSRSARGAFRTISRVIAVAVVASCAVAPAGAGETLGDLNVELNVIEVATDPGGGGLVRIEATLETFSAVDDVAVECFRSDGTPFTPATTALDGALVWRRDGSEEPVTLVGLMDLSNRDRVRSEIQVSLPDPGVYEIVLKAAGRAGARTIHTEALARIPVGVEPPRPVEFEGAVEYMAVPESEVQP